MTVRRGIQVPEVTAVPVRLTAGERSGRNEERFRAQVVELLRDRDREIEDLRLRIEQLEAIVNP